jgi:hypothetical protein
MGRSQTSQLPEDTLMWSENRPLILSDFKGEAIESPNLMGEAYCMILTTYDQPADSSGVTLSAHAIFDRTNSWISKRTRKEGNALLFQVTFNMFEVYARKLRHDAEELRSNSDAEAIFHARYLSAMSVLTYKCNELKRDTRMGADRVRLKDWDEKIKKELKSIQPL